MGYPAEICLIRHGESQANLEKKEIHAHERTSYPQELAMESDADVRLTARGIEQARATGRALAQEHAPYDLYYVSPWVRTRETFEGMMSAFDAAERERILRRTAFDERLREHERGLLTWLTSAQIEQRYPEEAHRRQVDGEYYYRPLGGESWADLLQRLNSLFETWARAHAGARILVVAHSTVLVCFRKLLLHLDAQTTLAIYAHEHPHNCAICRFSARPDAPGDAPDQEPLGAPEWRLTAWNSLAYGPELASVVPEERQNHREQAAR